MKPYYLFLMVTVIALPILFGNAPRENLTSQTVVSRHENPRAEGRNEGSPEAITAAPRAAGSGRTESPELEGTYVTRTGLYEMQISASGVITVSSRLDPVLIRYTFTRDGELLVIRPGDYLSGCYQPGVRAAAYRATWHGDNLNLSPIGDRIICRGLDLSAMSWSKKRVWVV